MLKRGALIVFEGCDRSGKTTQCKMLVESLKKEGFNVEMMRFPERSTSIGKICDEYLRENVELDDHAIHLMFSANRWELSSHILKQLKNGVTLIIDRYSFSGVAFSAAKAGMEIAWCKKPEVGLPKPDRVIFLDLDFKVQQQRGGFGGERYEKAEIQKKVCSNYRELMDDTWSVINADKSVEDLQTQLQELVRTIIAETDGEVRKLWVD